MELRHIRYFVAVAEDRNFTRAATRLGIGQPVLSQQIKALEAELGVVLLRRVPHGAELTEAGRRFYEEGLDVIAATQQAVVAAQRAARGDTGRLSVGFTGSAHFHDAVPRFIRDFGRHHPDVELRLDEAHSGKLLDDLSAGRIDVAFAHLNPEHGREVHREVVERDQLMAVLPAAHPCATRASVPLAALADDRFILKPSAVGPVLHATVVEACRSAGFTPRLGQEAPQIATLISLVAAELGVSLVPSSMRQVRASGVVYLPLEDCRADIALSLTWRRDERSSAVQNFISLIRRNLTASR